MSMTTTATTQDLGFGVHCIDTLQMRPGLACCYLVQRGADCAFIECGTTPGVPRLLDLLAARGIARERIRYVIPTHVHLDHAGGAGALMRALPAATLVAHPRAARHLVDPTKLIEGATAVYGREEVQRMYGEIVPVPEARTRIVQDDETLPFGDGELRFIDAPGHARHHFCVWDAASRGFFTGDTFGLSYRDLDGPGGAFILPTTTPVQFEPEAWIATLERLLAFAPQRMYLTHYGCVEEVPRLARELRAALQRYVALARSIGDARDRHVRLVAALADDALQALRPRGLPMSEAQLREFLAFDMDLNAQGLEVWLDRA
jgi:glyoxylase-like metal-dependent hydrolase (beta-lactamase superfamily II)